MEEEKWGVGSAIDKKAFDTVKMGEETVELFFGEHPHSRQDNNIYARTKSGSVYGFDGHRLPIKIEIEEGNYLKTSGLSGDQIRKKCSVKVFCDGIQILDEGHRSYEHGYRIAHQFILDMEMHWSWFPKKIDEQIEKIVGYREQLCKIKRVIIDQACLILETLDGKPFKRFLWEDDKDDDYEKESTIKVEITSPHITWYPKSEKTLKKLY